MSGRTHRLWADAAPPPHSPAPPTLQIPVLSADELEVAIQGRTVPLVIDFFASWCGPCLLLAKELEAVQAELGGAVRVVKVDVDANPDLASQAREREGRGGWVGGLVGGGGGGPGLVASGPWAHSPPNKPAPVAPINLHQTPHSGFGGAPFNYLPGLDD